MATVDLLVIGGGIHGACVARDAALRGLSVVLVEKDDLASGTSSRSSKLIHGGIRYLETFQFGLVREALRERAILLRTAPSLVRPLSFLMPFYARDARPAWLLRLGLSLYDSFAGKGARRHTTHTAGQVRRAVPSLPSEGLEGGAWYEDAQMDDALLVVANAMAAAAAGATVRTRCALTALRREGAWRATLASGEEIEARVVINAAGPWVDAVRARATGGPSATLRRTRGTHVVVPALTGSFALLLFARRDGRVFFVLPWGDSSLVGTTDSDDAHDPDDVSATADDVRYLWDEIARRWPSSRPSETTRRVFAGLRPLAASPRARPWDNSREARLLVEDGLVTMVGGKYTTARLLAEHAVDAAVRALGRAAAPCVTAHETLPFALPPDTLAREDVVRMVDTQFATRVSDVVFRRSRLWLDADRIRAAAPDVATWMGLGEATRATQLAEVEAQLDHEANILAAAREGS